MDFFNHVGGLALMWRQFHLTRSVLETDVYGPGDWRLNSTTRPNDVWQDTRLWLFAKLRGGFCCSDSPEDLFALRKPIRGPADSRAMMEKVIDERILFSNCRPGPGLIFRQMSCAKKLILRTLSPSSSNHRDAKGEKWICGDTSGLTTSRYFSV